MGLFGGMNFPRTVQKYCNEQGWKIDDLNDRRAILKFNMPSGRAQTLFIILFESTLEFSVPSIAIFDSEKDIPHFLSTILLKRSAERKIGFWVIEEINGKHVYSCMHNAELQLMNGDYFAKVVRALVTECDTFEGLLLDILRQS